jgi:hypothetical protein
MDRLTGSMNATDIDLRCEYLLSSPPAYTGMLTFSGLDLARFIRGADPNLYSSDLSGLVSFSGAGFDAEHFRLSTGVRLSSGRYRDWGFDSVGGKVSVGADAVFIDSLLAVIDGTQVETAGRIGFDGNMELDYE